MKLLTKPNHEKAYNAYRLETQFGGTWSRHATKKGLSSTGEPMEFQDHYMTLYDGSVWEPRNPSQFYSTSIGRLMMVLRKKGD